MHFNKRGFNNKGSLNGPNQWDFVADHDSKVGKSLINAGKSRIWHYCDVFSCHVRFIFNLPDKLPFVFKVFVVLNFELPLSCVGRLRSKHLEQQTLCFVEFFQQRQWNEMQCNLENCCLGMSHGGQWLIQCIRPLDRNCDLPLWTENWGHFKVIQRLFDFCPK